MQKDRKGEENKQNQCLELHKDHEQNMTLEHFSHDSLRGPRLSIPLWTTI